MSRELSGDDRLDNDPRTHPSASGGAAGTGNEEQGERQPGRADNNALHLRTHRREVPVAWRQRTVYLRESARATLQVVGTFRTVGVPDLARAVHAGDLGRAEADVRTLIRQGWLERHTVPGRCGGRAEPVLVLSKEGRAFAERHVAPPGQRMYTGLVKPKELAHDAALYRVAQLESARITRAGGRIRRIVMDAELKGEVASARNRAGAGTTAERTAAIAQSLHLRVVNGTVQIPDVRLEYETREGTQARVDLELATEHYKPSQVAVKAQAGFTIYAPASQTGRLSAALEDRGVIAEIVSL